MDLTVAIELIKKYTLGHSNFVSKATIAERYYRNKNDILLVRKRCRNRSCKKCRQ